MATPQKKTRTGSRKKARRNQHSEEAEPEFQIAPMIDILLVLLVFFMSISSTEVLQANQEVDLPVAKNARAPKTNASQTIINVLYNELNNATTLEIDQQSYDSPAALVSRLQAALRGNPTFRVFIRADKDVRYEYMRSLLEAIGQAGIANVTFSVVDKEIPNQAN